LVSLADPQSYIVFAKSDPVVFDKTFDIAELRSLLANFPKGSNISLDSPIFLLLQLIREGYSSDQILEAIFFGYSIREDCDYRGGNCDRYLADDQGEKVRPNRSKDKSAVATPDSDTSDPSSEGSPDNETTEPTPEPEVTPEVVLPLTLAGVGTYTLGGARARNGCPAVADVTITLKQDGTVTGVINFDVVSMQANMQPGGFLEPICGETGESGSMDISGTHKDGSITAGPGHSPSWLSGEFDASGGSLSGRLVSVGNFFGGDGHNDFDFPELEE